ncbi:MAG: hypothetical protein K2P84_14085, partial [Undibacterium sp.]|nr:hypothetical protein [Undibacterium sp.]
PTLARPAFGVMAVITAPFSQSLVTGRFKGISGTTAIGVAVALVAGVADPALLPPQAIKYIVLLDKLRPKIAFLKIMFLVILWNLFFYLVGKMVQQMCQNKGEMKSTTETNN